MAQGVVARIRQKDEPPDRPLPAAAFLARNPDACHRGIKANRQLQVAPVPRLGKINQR